LQGLGEVLEQQLISCNIGISLTYPLDMLILLVLLKVNFLFCYFDQKQTTCLASIMMKSVAFLK
jgi:hypothetical protein